MKKVWVNKAYSFKEAQDFDDRYYLSMSKIERLETVQFLRDIYGKIKGGQKYAGRKRLRRLVKIIKQK